MPFVLSLLTRANRKPQYKSQWEASISKELAYHINVKF